METIKRISKFFTSKEALHRAAEKGNYREVERLINLGLDVNAYYADCTPLQNCLISREPEKNNGCALSAILLLEHGADPNAFYKFKYNGSLKKTIQTHVNGGDLSTMRLLIMFGATSDGIRFNPTKPEVKHMFLNTQHNYQKIKQLEVSLSQSQINIKKKASFLLEIGSIWEKLSQEETNKVYQDYYQEKADHYFNLANNLKTNPNPNPNAKFSDNSNLLRRRFKNEKEPLLVRESQEFSFRK